MGARKFSLHRGDVSLVLETEADWGEVDLVESESDRGAKPPANNDLEGLVSPAFRRTVFAPYLKLTARSGKKPCIFRTTFLASEPS